MSALLTGRCLCGAVTYECGLAGDCAEPLSLRVLPARQWRPCRRLGYRPPRLIQDHRRVGALVCIFAARDAAVLRAMRHAADVQ